MQKFSICLALGMACWAFAAALPQAGYPPYVKKTLYASKDWRGEVAPKLVVGKWMTSPPPSTKGKVVIYDFWATWCPSCIKTIPELGHWQHQHPKDLVVIGVSEETEKTIRKFMKKTPMRYNVAIDPKKRMYNAVMVDAPPHLLVVTPDGIVRWQGYPLDEADPLTDAKLNQIIKTAMAR